jgi:hypothetical protein
VSRDAWEKWWDAHRHPRNSAENANLAQYDAAYFSQHIVQPLKKKAVESEAQFRRYKKQTGILRLFFRAVFSIITGFTSFSLCCYLFLEFKPYFIPEICQIILFLSIPILTPIVLGFRLELFKNIGIVISIVPAILILVVEKRYNTRDFCIFIAILILQYVFFSLIVKYISKIIERHELLEKNLLYKFKKMLCSVRESLSEGFKKFLQALLELHSCLIADPSYSLLRHWRGCASAGGIPASNEAHGLSLLSAQLSTFDVFPSLFFPAGKHFRTGGGNNGLVPV